MKCKNVYKHCCIYLSTMYTVHCTVYKHLLCTSIICFTLQFQKDTSFCQNRFHLVELAPCWPDSSSSSLFCYTSCTQPRQQNLRKRDFPESTLKATPHFLLLINRATLFRSRGLVSLQLAFLPSISLLSYCGYLLSFMIRGSGCKRRPHNIQHHACRRRWLN